MWTRVRAWMRAWLWFRYQHIFFWELPRNMEKRTICIPTCLQTYSRSKYYRLKRHDYIGSFLKFFIDEVWDLLVTETNRYAAENLSTSHHAQKWKSVTVQEMKAFVGILIMIGILQLPLIKCNENSMMIYFLEYLHLLAIISLNKYSRQVFTLGQ